jgi:hypothetical protein
MITPSDAKFGDAAIAVAIPSSQRPDHVSAISTEMKTPF